MQIQLTLPFILYTSDAAEDLQSVNLGGRLNIDQNKV